MPIYGGASGPLRLNHHCRRYSVVRTEAKAGGYRQNARRHNGYGRTLPAPNRFPSAANGVGFKAAGGLRSQQGTQIRHSHHARHSPSGRSAKPASPRYPVPCSRHCGHRECVRLEHDMYGVDTSKPGAQAYYDSLVNLYASWGVDYIKADDMAAPTYPPSEIEALSIAIGAEPRHSLSLSPGNWLSTDHADHLKQYSEPMAHHRRFLGSVGRSEKSVRRCKHGRVLVSRELARP